MPIILAIPILAFVLMLQTVVVTSLPLLSGFADLMLLVLVAWALQERVKSAWIWTAIGSLMVAFVSAAPWYATIGGYVAVTVMVRLLRRRVWQTPILVMFVVTFFGSIISQGITLVALLTRGAPLPLLDSLNLVILPGTLLNLLLALPVYAVVTDMAQWLYPEEVEV